MSYQKEVLRLVRHLLLLAPLWLVAAAPAAGEEPVDYLRQIKPVLQARCYACHGALKQQAELRLDTVALAIKGGENGAAIVPKNVGESLLLKRVTADESERMPPEGEPLSAAQISLLKAWIAQGAKAPSDEQPERDPRAHWAFQPPKRVPTPTPANAKWPRNPIDAFISAEHAKRGLTPQPAADKRVWLRRVYLDLVGLPPTIAELEELLADDSVQAEEAVVDRLLASPLYGERWGRHWMDIWRYSDWWGLGAEVRNSQKHIWHWRDWIIESQNADKGYDQMLREMLAADELYPNDQDRLRGTGFLARQYFKFNRTSWLDETIEHTSKAMLGLTWNCAKCHDHKYDPLTHADYYRLRAVFEPYQVRTDMVPGEVDFERDGLPRVFDCNLDAQTFLHLRGDERNPDKSRALEPAVPAFLSHAEWKIEPVTLPAEAYRPGLRALVLANHLKAAEQKVAATRAALNALPSAAETDDEKTKLTRLAAEKALAAADAQIPAIRARAAAEKARSESPAAADAPAIAREAVKLERQAALAQAEAAVAQAELDLARAPADKKAEPEKKLTAARAAVEPARKAVDMPAENFTPLSGALKTLESNLENEESRRKPFPQTSSGRRKALALWLTDPRHPLPARVAVNHLWLRHFGRPLVPTVFDFGRKGAPPSHPELLDWLAVELIEHDWSLKHIHRLIVTSQAYRMTSSSAGALPEMVARDPDNHFLWRANSTRAEAQVVRDSLLHMAGELDLARGGPSIPVANEASRRRSLYFVHSHNEHQMFLSLFDDANVLDCYRRAESILPQQALALENSPFAASLAEKIARRITSEGAISDREFSRIAFLTVLTIEPSEAELALATEGLTMLTDAARLQKRPQPEAHARAGLVQSLINHNDFVTVR